MIPQDCNTSYGPTIGCKGQRCEGDPRQGAGESSLLGYSSISDRWLDEARLRTDDALKAAEKIAGEWSQVEKDKITNDHYRDTARRAESQRFWEGYAKDVLQRWGCDTPLGYSEGWQGDLDADDTRQRVTVKIYRKLSIVHVAYKLPDRKAGDSRGGGRGQITDFTEKSRNRMQEQMAIVDDTRQAFFLTLTYPDKFPDDPKVFKAHIAAFRKRLARLYEEAGGLWRLEPKRRKSGKNKGLVAPHYHLIVWLPDGPTTANFKEWVQRAWAEIIGEAGNKHARRHGCDVRRIENMDHASYYVAKYASKTDDDGQGLAWGRRWAFFGKVAAGGCMKFKLTLSEHHWLKFLIGGWLAGRGESAEKYAAAITNEGNHSGYRALGLGRDTIDKSDGRRLIYKYMLAAMDMAEWEDWQGDTA